MSDGEATMLREALIEMNRENSWWGQVLDFSVSSASFGVELGTTGGIATATKKGALELAGLGLRRLATVEGRQQVERLLLTRLALGTVGLAGQTATASLSHVMSKAYKDSLHFDEMEMMRGRDGKVIIGLEAGYEPGSMWDKLPAAFVHQMVENGSEKMGAEKMGAEKAGRYLAQANARLAKLEIQGIPQEIAEEYAAALGHTVFEGEEFSPPGFDDITALMASMVISRGGSMAVDGVMGRDGRGSEAQMPSEVGAGATATEDADMLGHPEGGEMPTEQSLGEQPRVAFSRGEELATGRQMTKQMQEVAQPGAFRRGPASQAKDLGEIVREYSLVPGEAKVMDYGYPFHENETTYRFEHQEGGVAYIHVGKDRVWVTSNDMRSEEQKKRALELRKNEGLDESPEVAQNANESDYIQGGDLLYQAAMTYAYNNGLKFMPDDVVSDIAVLRRNSHMLSNALRHRTTRHLSPFSQKVTANDPVAAGWKEGDSQETFEHNLELLANQELQNVAEVLDRKGLDISDLRYDGNSDTIEKRTENPDGTFSEWQRLSEGDLKSLVEGLDPGNSGVGKTTLSRALVIQSALEGQNVVQRAAGDYQSEESLRGGVVPASPGATIQRVLGSREDPKSIFYSRGESSGSERVQRTGVTRAETTAAEARLKSTAQGRAIYGNVLIVDNRAQLDGLQGRPGEQRYHAEDWDIMQDAEGFHDPRDGTVVIFRDNVRVLEGETAAQALARVVVHERVGHHGFDALRESDSKFAEEWSKLAAAIPADQMKELEGRYEHLNGNREALALEWFAHQVGNMEGRAQLQPGSVVQRMWQAMRDWVVRKMQPLGDPSKDMTQEVIDAHMRGIIRATRRSMVRGASNTRESKSANSAKPSNNARVPSGDRTQFSAQSSDSSRADPRILEAFGPNIELDQYNLPVPPRTLSDNDPLLEPTKGKKFATLDPDHILVLSGKLPGGAEIPRKQLHNAIVQYFLEQGRPVPAGDQPVVIAAGGGGGSGKSTVLKRLERQGQLSLPGAVTVNPDDIAPLLPEFSRIKATGDSRAASTVHSEASHLSERLMAALLAQPANQRSHIVYDSTLAWKDSALKHFQRWRSHGYQINLIGVTAAPQEAMVRAAIRAKKSGRWVPHDVLAQAHAGFNSSVRDYLQYVDEAHLFDNTGSTQASIATKEPTTGKIHIVNQQLWDTLITRGQRQ